MQLNLHEFNPLTCILDTQSEVVPIEVAILCITVVAETIASSGASSHRPATYPADVVNRVLISRDDVKRHSDQVQTINCIEVSDSNEWYRLAPFHYTNTVTRRGLQIEINSRLGTAMSLRSKNDVSLRSSSNNFVYSASGKKVDDGWDILEENNQEMASVIASIAQLNRLTFSNSMSCGYL